MMVAFLSLAMVGGEPLGVAESQDLIADLTSINIVSIWIPFIMAAIFAVSLYMVGWLSKE